MAVIHISRDEAANNFDGLVARVHAGDRIVIEEDRSPIAVLESHNPHVRLLSTTILILEDRGSTMLSPHPLPRNTCFR